MRVAFVVNDLQLSGGVGVVVEHARQLSGRHGFEVDLVLARSQDEPDWGFRGLGGMAVHGMAAARREGYDVAVATWWETVGAALELPAERHVYFVQSLEDRFYRRGEPERLGAALTHDLPLHTITEARWIAALLDGLVPGRRTLLVRNGIAKDVFTPPPAPPVRVDEPLRVLIEGDPDVWFKGVPEALTATSEMREPREVTLVRPRGGDRGRAGEASAGGEAAGRDRGGRRPKAGGADRVVGPLTQAELAQEYARADVLLKLSRVEGMSGPPLEAFHAGTTCVVTAVTGHEEYVVHGENGLVVEWDDPRGTARALDLLARDRALLHRLRWSALATARGWPSWEQQGAVMAAALHEIARRPPVAGPRVDAALLADLRAGVQAQRAVLAERDRLRWRVAPLDAVDRVLETRGVRKVARPARRAWGRARRALGR